MLARWIRKILRGGILPMMSTTRFWYLMLLSVAIACPASSADADMVRLKWGGEVRGSVTAESHSKPQLTINTLTGGTVVFDRAQVEFVRVRSPLFEEYVTRQRTAPLTAAGHWELAEWCREHGLKPQRTEQLEQVVAFDPDHEVARKQLDHVRYKGKWMPKDEMMAAQGYFKHKSGRYVTEQELELMEQSTSQRSVEKEWYAKVRQSLIWATSTNHSRREEGAAQLSAIREPAAVTALTTLMAENSDPEIRSAFVTILGKIPGDRPVPPLIRRLLHDSQTEVRGAAWNSLKPDRYHEALRYVVPGLKEKENSVVRRAGTALGRMGDLDASPFLIDALVTTHSTKIAVARKPVAFSTAANGVTNLGAQTPVYPGLAPNQVYQEPPTYDWVPVQVEVMNEEVHEALRHLTGEDFGFNEMAWRNWWRTRRKSG